MSKLRILLVSVGMFGQHYLRELTGPNVDGDLIGIVDIAPNLKERFPVIGERQIPVYSSLDAFYAEDTADLAVICAPIHLHTEMVMTALSHGSHVLCEKPLCADEAETLQMAKAAEDAGRVLAVGWQLNYDPVVLRIKQDILSGRLGKPICGRCIHAMRRGRNYYSRNNWSGHITVDGRPAMDSPFMNGCAHNFQLMTFLLGDGLSEAQDICSVEGELYRANPVIENYDIAALRFTTESQIPLLYLTAHPLAARDLGHIAEIRFDKGSLTWGRHKPYRFGGYDGTSIIYSEGADAISLRKLHDVIHCIQNGTMPVSLARTGLPHLRAVTMAQKLPIRQIDPAHIEVLEGGGDRFLCVTDLETVLMNAYDSESLPDEIGLTL